MPETARNNDAHGRQRLKLITAVGLVILVGFAGVVAWQQWPTGGGHLEPDLKPLDTFMDCGECPEMVMIPGGIFTMGSPGSPWTPPPSRLSRSRTPVDDPDHQSEEGPQHRVTIAPFAMGKTEVTFAEWDACVIAGGCNGYKPADEGWGRGSRPVINVSWEDAKAYVNWLSQHTGKPYRLPSEAEWEYAARAGTTTHYSFGDAITPKHANCCHKLGKTTEVGAYPPNAWGLYDMQGNVWERVEDTWHWSYEGAPVDGAAWTDGEQHLRVDRGGSWFSDPWTHRSATRSLSGPGGRSSFAGFRVARTLERQSLLHRIKVLTLDP